MNSFWNGFEKKAGVRSFGRALGKGVESVKGALGRGASATASGGKGMAQSITSAPGRLREGYRQGRAAARNEAALSKPLKSKRGVYPGGVKPTTSASTKSKHYRDVAKEKAPPSKPKVEASSIEKTITKDRDSLFRKAMMPVGAGAIGAGIGIAGSQAANNSQQASPGYR